MKTKCFVCFVLVFLVVGIIGCGDDDDDATSTPTTTTTETSTSQDDSSAEAADEVPVEVNFAAEEAAVRAIVTQHDAAFNKKEEDLIMGLWLDEGSVVLAHNFFGLVVEAKGLQKVRNTWGTIFDNKFQKVMKSIIDEVGVDAGGENATVIGKYELLRNNEDFTIALKKNDDGDWKISGIDYAELGIIKQIKTPR